VITSTPTPKDRHILTPRAEISRDATPESNLATWPTEIGWPAGHSGRRAFSRPALLLLMLAVAHPLPATAQDTAFPLPSVHVIHWWEGALAVGAVSGLMLLDHPIQRFAQDNRSSSGNDVARTFRHFGQPEIYGTVTLGLIGAGWLSGHTEVTRAGGRLAASLALAGATSTLAKLTLGRPRPSESQDVDGFVPFSGQDAMPSGHTTMAFALATALSDDIRKPWASIGLYTIAAGVGWSRINDNRHWISDVAAGALVGITSAKIVDGRWRLFNLHPPRVLIGPQQAEIAWQVAF
jgi:membrane-associated phospholipid phosphatase